MDEKDGALIEMLRRDSRTPLKTLGASIGLSASATQERLQRLEREQVIEAFTIRVAPEARAARAYMLLTTEARNCAEVAPRIQHIQEVVVCDSVAGEIDMILTVEAASGERLQAIRDEIAAVEGVKSVVTAARLVRRFARGPG
jgi:Lrp/AsnC family leucine-responsive transcriptional regulator